MVAAADAAEVGGEVAVGDVAVPSEREIFDARAAVVAVASVVADLAVPEAMVEPQAELVAVRLVAAAGAVPEVASMLLLLVGATKADQGIRIPSQMDGRKHSEVSCTVWHLLDFWLHGLFWTLNQWCCDSRRNMY